VAEVDPIDPQSVPVKRSALGRIGAQAVAATVAEDGRAVVFLADGRPMGFLYRFVSTRPAREGDALDAGQLSVARVEGEAIAWQPLPEAGLLTPYVAAEQAGASPFDTPAALAADPRRMRILLGCRAGTTRGAAQVDALNPRPGPHPGQVIEIAGDLAAPRTAARILFLAGDAAEGGQYGRDMPAKPALVTHAALARAATVRKETGTRTFVLGSLCWVLSVFVSGFFFHSVGGLKDLPFTAQRSLRHRAHWWKTQARAQPNQPPTGQDDALYCHGLRVLVGLARSRARREARRRPNSARRLHGTNQI
jgi:hypothetical protein